MSGLHEAATAYLEAGYSVIPIWKDKEPMVGWNAYQRALPTKNELKHWFREESLATGIGIITGPVSGGLVILDFDSKDDENGWEEAYADILDITGPTKTVTTGSGHKHIYLEFPNMDFTKQIITCSTSSLKFRIEVRGAEHQTLAPPSIHPRTHRPYVVDDTSIKVKAIINWSSFLETIRERWERHPLPKRTREFLKSGASIGAQHDEALYAAAQLRDSSYSEIEAREEIFNALSKCPIRNNEPWTIKHADEIVRAIYNSDPRPPAIPTNQNIPLVDQERASENGIMVRVVRANKHCLLYSSARKSWYGWSGRHWQRLDGVTSPDRTTNCYIAIKEAFREVEFQIRERYRGDPKSLQKALGSLTDLIARNTYSSVEGLLREELPVNIDQMDRYCHYLNLQNGTFNLEDLTLQPHNPHDMITRLCPYPYDPGATCPNWETFLGQVFKGHEDVIPFVRRAIGYTLIGKIREHVIFFLYGSGRNGKSTFLRVLRLLLGDEAYSARITFDAFKVDASDSQKGQLARLHGMRAAVASDPSQGGRLDTGLLKDFSGGEKILTRQIYEKHFEFYPEFKLWLATNDQPNANDSSGAFADRLQPIPFEISFKGHENTELFDTLLAPEVSGILNWAIEGLRDWKVQGLGGSPTIRNASSEIRASIDTIARFLDENCEVSIGAEVKLSDMYASYEAWKVHNGMAGMETISKIMFSRRLKDKVRHLEVIYPGGVATYTGIKLLLLAGTQVVNIITRN